MKIAEIQKLANQILVPEERLCHYLDKLINLFVSPTQTSNLVDLASLLDIVIRNTAKQNPENRELASLASQNVFRTHVNRQAFAELRTMFLQGRLEPSANVCIGSLSDSQIGLETQDLYDIMSDAKREHFYIVDIDGTLKENEPACVNNAIPQISDQVRNDLITLSRKPGNKVVILTARSKDQIKQSNVPFREIPVLTAYGIESIHGDDAKVLHKHELLRATPKLVSHIHKLFENLGINKSQYDISFTPGNIYIQFTENSITAAKNKALTAFGVLIAPDSGWSLINDGKHLIIQHSVGPKYDKGIALKKLLKDYKDSINSKTNIYVLGDTGSDYKAMKALKEVDLPEGVKKVNIAVGTQLTDRNKYPAVDVRLSTHHAVADLLNWLAV